MSANKDDRTRESITVRGICQSILSMNYPSLQNLEEMIKIAFNKK